jgi:hypothetical protein
MTIAVVLVVTAIVFVVLVVAAQRYLRNTVGAMTDDELIGEMRPRGVTNRAVEQELKRRGYSRVPADREWGSSWDWRKKSEPGAS